MVDGLCWSLLLQSPTFARGLRFVSSVMKLLKLYFPYSRFLWHGEGHGHGGPCHEGGLRHDRGLEGPKHLAGYCWGLRMTCLLCWWPWGRYDGAGPRCRGPAGLDAGHHVGHYAGVTRYVPSSDLDFLENVDCTHIINFYIFRLISLPGSEVGPTIPPRLGTSLCICWTLNCAWKTFLSRTNAVTTSIFYCKRFYCKNKGIYLSMCSCSTTAKVKSPSVIKFTFLAFQFFRVSPVTANPFLSRRGMRFLIWRGPPLILAPNCLWLVAGAVKDECNRWS